jgi:hypothetical protein
MGVSTFECPYPVNKVIIGYGQGKTNGVSNVLIDFDFLLAQPCRAEIYRHPEETR